MIIAATGHRPNKLGGYSQAAFRRLVDLATEYLRPLRAAGKVDGCISGMAQGWDQGFAGACCNLGIPWTAAVPYVGQEVKWPSEAQERFRRLIRRAAHVKIVEPGGYAVWKLQKRNEYMVDRADCMAALWDGSAGGTRNCVEYALNKGKPVTNLYQEWKAMVGK